MARELREFDTMMAEQEEAKRLKEYKKQTQE